MIQQDAERDIAGYSGILNKNIAPEHGYSRVRAVTVKNADRSSSRLGGLLLCVSISDFILFRLKMACGLGGSVAGGSASAIMARF